MAELKTKKNDASVQDYLAGIEDDGRREECMAVLELIRESVAHLRRAQDKQ